MSFVHLHVHSEYSLLDGLSHPQQIVKRAKELHQPAVALTDHGVMFGVIDFYNAARKAGVKPIIGVEAYLARRTRLDRDPNKDKSSHHLLLLAQNDTGYKNLLRLSSLAQLEGFYYRPRVDKEILEQYSEGLIVTTGCGSAEIPRLLQAGQIEQAREAMSWYLDVFGRDRFFVELQLHEGLPGLVELNKQLLDLGKRFNVRPVATNDAHYIRPENAPAQDIMICIGTTSLVSDPKRMRMSDNSYYLKSADEMALLFGGVPDALSNTLLIAEMCAVDLDRKGYHLPEFPVPAGYSAETYLRKICEEGLIELYGERARQPDIRQRLDYELSVINQMGFDAYFLIVSDLTRYAHEHDIWWNVRGSAAGSIVAYTSRITLIDPLKHGLIFERFLNPGRISMPDIDLDFPDDRRAEMIDYTVKKYGDDKVAQIITFGTLGARAAIRDVARALDVPLNEVDRLAKMVPAIPGKPITLPQALEQIPDLKAAYESADYIRNLLDAAIQVEGTARNVGTHAAGVIVADKPLIEYVPLHRPTKSGDNTLGSITQFEMGVCEDLGLLKIDFLGLSTLTIMRKACELIEQRHGVHYDLTNIPTDDPELFKLISRGDVIGLFQVEGSGMRRMLTEMKPTKFEHIVAAISLFRPGPMEYIPTYIRRMHGDEPIEYKHPKLEAILDETYGIIVYQEQIIQIASQLAGYAPGDADGIRKAVGKKIQAKIDEHRSKFIKGAVNNGIAQSIAEAIYDDIEFFARYGFNKAHAADYAVITCQTAFLKAHYPVEYMTALLSVERNNTEKVGLLIAEARRMGIDVLPPDVTRSEMGFSIEATQDNHEAIRYGLAAIKNVGEAPVQAVLDARSDGGPFRDLDDFCTRVDLRQVNRRALEGFIKVGAFGTFGSRAQLLDSIDRMLGSSSTLHRARDAGQMSLFGDMGLSDASSIGPLPNIDEAQLRERLAWEKELIGVYISEHPISRALSQLTHVVSHLCSELNEEHHDQSVTLLGLIANVRKTMTKKGAEMAFVTLEDVQGSIEVVVFPRSWKEYREMFEIDKIVLVRGKVDAQGRRVSVLLDSIDDNPTAYAPADGSHPAISNRPSIRSTPAPHASDTWTPTEPAATYNVDQPISMSTTSEPNLLQPTAMPPYAHAESEPQQIPEPVAPKPKANGATTSARHYSPAAPEPPQSTARPNGRPPGARLIHVTLERTGNGRIDAKRFGDAHRVLISYSGGDRFTFHVKGGNSPAYAFDFPNDTTLICEELIRQLRSLLGPDAISWNP